MSQIETKVMNWLREQNYTVTKNEQAEGANVYKIERGTSYPVSIVFPDVFSDVLIIQAGVNITGPHREVLESISDEVEKKRILDEINYEIMSNTNVGSTKRIENGIILGVGFESELFLDGITKTNFFQQVVYVRSAVLKFMSYIRKEF